MMRRFAITAVGAASILWITAACASAQPRVEALTPAGLERVEVRAPDHEDIPVRLVYAPSGAQSAQVWMDVWVGESADAAQRRAEQMASRVAAGLAPRDDLGDRAWGDPGMVVLSRGAVAVTVRVVGGDHDAVALARHVDGSLQRNGSPPGVAPRMTVDAGQDAHATISFDGPVLAAHVTATGDAYARRTRDGWVLVVTGEGPYAVEAFVVDRALRVHRIVAQR